MSKKDEALKLAEDALKRVRTQDMELVQLSMIALAAIQEALASEAKEQPAPATELREQEPKKDLMYSTVAMQERHAAFVDRAVATLEQAKREALAEQPAQQQEPVAVPTTSYEHRKFVLVGRDWYERFAAFHDDCQIGEQLTWQEKTIRQQGYENGWNDAQRYLKEPQSTSPTPAQQEPVAWMYPDDYERMTTSETFCTVYSVEVGSATRGESTVALYTSPPTLSLAQRTWDGKAIEDLVKEELRYYRDGHYIEFSDAEYQLRSFAHRLAAQRTWVNATTWRGLTVDEILYCVELENPKAIAEEVEAKLKEKNA